MTTMTMMIMMIMMMTMTTMTMMMMMMTMVMMMMMNCFAPQFLCTIFLEEFRDGLGKRKRDSDLYYIWGGP